MIIGTHEANLSFPSCRRRLLPETAEQLMRSRYTAFTQANEPYLLATWHESTRPVALGFDADEPVTWLRLRVDKVEAGVMRRMMAGGWVLPR